MTHAAGRFTELPVINKGIEPFCCRQKSNWPRGLTAFSTTVSRSFPAGVSFAPPELANLFFFPFPLLLAQYGVGATPNQH